MIRSLFKGLKFNMWGANFDDEDSLIGHYTFTCLIGHYTFTYCFVIISMFYNSFDELNWQWY